MPPLTQNLQSSTRPAALLANTMKALWCWLVALLSDPALIAVAIFCTIGLLITLNLIVRFPDFTAVSEQFQQHP